VGVQYIWETITAAQALAFAVGDTTFSTGNGRLVTVTFNDAAERVTVTDTVGRSVVFGGGVYGAQLHFGNDSTPVRIGSPQADFINPDAWMNIFAGSGNDTISAPGSPMRLSGGPGQDLFDVGAATPTIVDWDAGDSLRFSTVAATALNYVEATRSSSEAAEYANSQIGSGAADYVAVQVGADVLLFADANNNQGQADAVVTLLGRTLADISFANIVGAAAPTAPNTPTTPTPPAPPTQFDATASISGNMDNVHLSALINVPITVRTSTELQIDGGLSLGVTLNGQGFVYDANGQLVGGQVSRLLAAFANFSANVSGQFSAAPFLTWVVTDATQQGFATILAGNDRIDAGPSDDVIRSYGGNDVIQGFGGANIIFAGPGDDWIYGYASTNLTAGTAGSNYLRGDEGNDVVVGGAAFDDINGNMGNDTAYGGLGDDWVVGGKDQDLLFGDVGNDIVYGNLGDDTCSGGDGSDTIRGGQANDTLAGGVGNDWLSGDRGNDTISGGTGADIFHTFGDAGLDRVTDFNATEGDQVMLDPGTQYTTAQLGADTVVSMTGGGQMVLVGVQLSTLPAGWIFVG
jgi:Ca2+-binding RTX toxin-like protein